MKQISEKITQGEFRDIFLTQYKDKVAQMQKITKMKLLPV